MVMDDATQKLVDEARSLTPPGRVAFTSHERMVHRLANALEAAQRPPVSPEVDRLRAQVEAAREAWWSGTEQGDTGLVYTDRIEDAMDAIWDAIGHADWTPRQRPPVSPEQREVLIEALLKVPGNERGPAHGEPGFWPYFSDDEEDRRDAGRFVDAILAQWSLPVLDVGKVAQWLRSHDDYGVYRDGYLDAENIAAALVASLYTLTDEEKNDA